MQRNNKRIFYIFRRFDMEGILEQILYELKEIKQLLAENKNITTETGIGYINNTMKVKEASAYLGITEWQLRTLAKQGKIKHLRSGNRYLFRRHSLDLWMIEVQENSIKKDDDPEIKKGLWKVKV
jgi:excisionase family DNA binding protein